MVYHRAMREKNRYYCFKLTSQSETVRVRADRMEEPHERRYRLYIDDEIVGNIEKAVAWWIEEVERER